MTPSEQELLKEIQAVRGDVRTMHNPFGDPVAMRGHVVSMLVQLGLSGGDTRQLLSKAKTICDFIETGNIIDIVK